ncbi:hypothetical protein EAG_01212 [Camponotus floridanus]|uniref:Uncharacterized protein n=1 Tax=Camponotus floridanus TaxID=104421 RepID=E2AD47_CAMFO|nr:hypothetical protein EAG_01212 [Camponotus floridanus]
MVVGCDGLPALEVVVVTVLTTTVTVVYLDHAIDFRVGPGILSSLLSMKSETKCRQNCIENFFRNPAREYAEMKTKIEIIDDHVKKSTIIYSYLIKFCERKIHTLASMSDSMIGQISLDRNRVADATPILAWRIG